MKIQKKKKYFKAKRTENRNNKEGRLIVRNLPFSVTEEKLRSHFSPYGEINDISILKKPDGKLVGCGFVQYVRKQNAAKAIHSLSGKEFIGRPIIVDWAIPKDRFVQINSNVKQEVKEEPRDEDADSEFDDIEHVDEEYDDRTSSNDDDDDQDNDDSDDDHDSTENEMHGSLSKKDEHDIVSENSELHRKPLPSHDIPEGKTVFLKNLPFNVDNEELKQYMEENFGSVYYAVVCIDTLTEHSKGTAFVKFKDIGTAEKCIDASKFKIRGQLVEATKALSKNELKQMEQSKPIHPDKKKGGRNLYLVKEGVVVPNTPSAEGVSVSDMNKRLALEAWKSNLLRKTNMFVSDTRLIIHNLPLTYNDRDLRALFNKYSPKNSVITEARVMKNLRQVDMEGKPVSKGYGFVTFKQYNDALVALRSINNNPTIFNKQKRPIVSFSIENRTAITAKRKRMEKSKLRNPLCPDAKKLQKRPRGQLDTSELGPKTKKLRISKDAEGFQGIEAKPSTVVNIKSSKKKLKAQADAHRRTVMKQKRDLKKKSNVKEIRKDKMREPKVKSAKRKKVDLNEKQFNKLVNKYREKMPEVVKLKKWYEAE